VLVHGRGVDAAAGLEGGAVLLLPDEPFGPPPAVLFAQDVEGGAKNLSYDPATGALKGGPDQPERAQALAEALADFADWSQALLGRIAPAYAPALRMGKTSFRPRPAEKAISPRKDDRRLHVDAFPSQPARGRRILRVFRNVNPEGESRVWEVGEPFADYAARFLPKARPLAPGQAWLMQALGLTKARRSAYDQLMLGLHDAAKASDAYQTGAPRETLAFPPGATWIVFTDCVPHAAMSGRYAFEQTFFLPVEAMVDPERSPLRVLERMTGRKLI
jgi:hypothetical protein